jgi:formate dehydrogenase major subunit
VTVADPGREGAVPPAVRHRWEDLDLDTAMDMIADRVIATRRKFWE